MPDLPSVSGRMVVRVFESLGWEKQRQRGSHVILTRDNSLATLSVPNHRSIAKGTLRALIRAAELTVNDFLDALRKL